MIWNTHNELFIASLRYAFSEQSILIGHLKLPIYKSTTQCWRISTKSNFKNDNIDNYSKIILMKLSPLKLKLENMF